MMSEMFDVELQRRDYDASTYHKAKKEGIKEGIKEGAKENENKYLLSLLKHVNDGVISLDNAASIANMSVEEFMKACSLLTH